MSLLAITWSMVSAVGILLGVIHLMIWLRDRRQLTFLLAAIMASAAGALALQELGMMTRSSPEDYQRLVGWGVPTIYAILVPMTWFVYMYLGTVRRWLVIVTTAASVAIVLISFAMPGNIVYTSITALHIETTFWGEPFVVAEGGISPVKYISDLLSVLITICVADASVRAYRRGLRRKALMIGGPILFFIVVVGVHTPLVDTGLVRTPYMISFAFIAIALAMTVELVDQVVRAAKYGRELAAWEKKWITLLDEIHLAVVGLDRNGRINYVNPFFRMLTGLSEAQLLDRPAANLAPATQAARFEQWLAGAPETGPRKGIQFPIETVSGERREIVWSTVTLRNGGGTYDGMLSIGADISEQVQARKELQRTQHEMEHLTRAIILGELGSTLAHELNQPLSAILSNAQAAVRLLRQGPVNLEEIRDILTDVVADDRRAGEVIDRMQSMLKSGEVGSEMFELNAAVKEVLRLVEGERKKYDTAIEYKPTKRLITVSGGRIEIQQVVMNLLMNALQAVSPLPHGDRRVRIETSCAGDAVLIAVEDSGPGIPKDITQRIFEPFVTTKNNGLGMGLAISRRIVDAHGGSIKQANGDLGGARFEVALPLFARQEVAASA